MKRIGLLQGFLFAAAFGVQQRLAAQAASAPPGETPLPEIRPIDPPVATWPYPLWMMIAAGVVALVVLGALFWVIRRSIARRPGPPPPTPKEKALAALGALQGETEALVPYEISVKASDVLRHYLTQAHGLAATEQTSVEFLAVIARDPHFSEADKALLARFLEKTDLIKFARLAATTGDSRELLEQAEAFVRREETPVAQPGEAA